MSDAAEATSATRTGTIELVSHYLKDLSCENPQAPFSVNVAGQLEPKVDVHVTFRQLNRVGFETELRVTATGSRGAEPVILIELTYAGTYLMPAIPSEFIESFLLSEAPRELFPFVRALIVLITQNSGHAPLIVHTPNFAET
jgi:preprotein translocase subunit SecB